MQDPTEWLGYAAAGLVLATFSVRSLTALRSVAIASNLMFIAYAASAELLPVLVLHSLLLPLNAIRLRQSWMPRQQSALPTAQRGHRRAPRRRALRHHRIRRRAALSRARCAAAAAG